MSDSIIEQLKTYILPELALKISLEQIDRETKLEGEGLDLDSLGFVELIMAIEEHFGFQFLETEIEVQNFQSIGSLSRLIGQKVLIKDNVKTN
jgi:acyl carrier protein